MVSSITFHLFVLLCLLCLPLVSADSNSTEPYSSLVAMEVYYVNLEDGKGEEMKKTRPCILVSRNDLTALEEIYHVVPLTSKTSSPRPIEVLGVRLALLKKANHPGLEYDSLALVDQLRPVAKERIDSRKRLAVLTPSEMRIVVSGIPLVLQRQLFGSDLSNDTLSGGTLSDNSHAANSTISTAEVAAWNVYHANLDGGKGHEATGRVYGVVVQWDDLTARQKTALFVPFQPDRNQTYPAERELGIRFPRLEKRDQLVDSYVARIDHTRAIDYSVRFNSTKVYTTLTRREKAEFLNEIPRLLAPPSPPPPNTNSTRSTSTTTRSIHSPKQTRLVDDGIKDKWACQLYELVGLIKWAAVAAASQQPSSVY